MEAFPEAVERVELWTEVFDADGNQSGRKGLLYDYIKKKAAKLKLAKQLAANQKIKKKKF